MNEKETSEAGGSISPVFACYQISACGSFLVKRWDGTSYQPVPVGAWGGSHSPRVLLKALLCSPGRQVSRGRLLELLWPGIDPEDAARYLSDAAYRLRAVLRLTKGGESLLLTTKDTSTYALAGQEHVWVDADAALTLLEQAEAMEQHSGHTLSLLEEAASYLSRGEFLAEEDHLYFYGRRARVARARRGCLLALAKAYQQSGRLRRGEALLSGLLEENVLDEDALCALMLNLHQQGRTSEGLRLYEETKTLLEREGLAPTEATRVTEQQLRGGHPLPERRDAHRYEVSAKTQDRSLALDWGEAPSAEQFYGRQQEVALLSNWVQDKHCRVVAIFGMGGIGKTTLAVRLVETVKEVFTHVFWRSLQQAPPLRSFLEESVKFLSDQQQTRVLDDLDAAITSSLIELLRQRRVLLILDNCETMLQSGVDVGTYRDGYEDYGRLIQRLSEGQHQSCLLLTSRESIKEIVALEGEHTPVRSFHVQGLLASESLPLLRNKGLTGDVSLMERLNHLYAGNPLALKLVAQCVIDVFAGDLAAFFSDGAIVFHDIEDVLDQQTRRLTPLELEILYWLAIEREAVAPQHLIQRFVRPVTRKSLQDALQSLRRRSLIEMTPAGATVQNVIMEYLTQRFLTAVSEELCTGKLVLLESHALLLAQAKEYVRESQARLILQPLVQLLISSGQIACEAHLKNLLMKLRAENAATSYAAGNVLNLLIRINNDLRGYDFSHLTIRQAYLQKVSLAATNFAFSHFIDCVFTETFGSILSVTFSPDGRVLAAGTSNGEIRLWNSATGQLVHQLQGHNNWVRALTFSLDGKLLASGGDDETICVWDMEAGNCIQTLRGHYGWVRSLTFTLDGDMLISGSDDQTIRFWDYRRGFCLSVLQGHSDKIKSIALSPDGKCLASSSVDRTIRLWNVADRQCLKVLENPESSIWSIAFSPNGSQLASGDEYHVRIWDIASTRCVMTLEGHTKRIWSLAFSADGKTIVSGSEDGTIRLWERDTGRCELLIQGHKSVIWSIALHPQGEILASGGDDQCIRLWNRRTGACLKTLEGYVFWVNAVAVAPGTQLIASGEDHQQIHVWNLKTKQCIHTLSYPNRVRAVAFHPDGSLLAGAGDAQAIFLWEMPTGRFLKRLQGHTDWLNALVFSPDGRTLASGGEDRTIRLWNVDAALQHAIVLEGHTRRIRALAFTPNTQLLVSGGDDQTLRLWEQETGQCVGIWPTPDATVWSLACSPDGTHLASGLDDGTIRLWECKSATCVSLVHKNARIICSIVFFPDGQRLVSSADDGSIWLWNLLTMQGHLLRPPQPAIARSLALEPEEQMLVVGNNDGTVELWDSNMCFSMTLRGERPYEKMNIFGVRGLSTLQKAALIALGAAEYE